MDGSEGTSADVVARIIDAAAISPEAQSLFRKQFEEAVSRARRDIPRPARRDSIKAQLRRVTLKAEALRKVLTDLDPAAQYAFGLYAARQSLFGMAKDADESRFQLNDMVEIGYGSPNPEFEYAYLKEMVVKIKDAAETQLWPKNSKGGAPAKDNPDNPEQFSTFDSFVFDLVRLAQAAGRGLSLDKNSGGGSLATALKSCAALFPEKFVPLDEAGELTRLSRIYDVMSLAKREGRRLRAHSLEQNPS